jgi:hypothetical protein
LLTLFKVCYENGNIVKMLVGKMWKIGEEQRQEMLEKGRENPPNSLQAVEARHAASDIDSRSCDVWLQVKTTISASDGLLLLFSQRRSQLIW